MLQLSRQIEELMKQASSIELEPLDSARFAGVIGRRGRLEAAIASACKRVAPLWPLKHFIAVNPFLGFSDRSFSSTAAVLKRVGRIEMLMPRAFYDQAIKAGAIEEGDLTAALERVALSPNIPRTAEELKAAAARPREGSKASAGAIATVGEVLDRLADGDRQASLVGFMIDDISRWCAAYFDDGQSSWRMPNRDEKPYAAWRAAARYDRNPEVMGVRGFRRAILALPEDPVETIGVVADRLGIPDTALEDYLYRVLFDIGGWAAYARYLAWIAELQGETNDTLVELLAIRVAYGFGLFQARTDEEFKTAWADAMRQAAQTPCDDALNDDPDLAIDLILQDAYEAAFQRRMTARLAAHATRSDALPNRRPPVQAAFCIDVRSEIFRRALETVCPQAETIGFAGFFGFAIEYVPIGRTEGGAQCPVLLRPSFVVCETVKGATEEEKEEVLGLRLLRRRAAKAWKAFKLSAVSSFAFVESAGLLYAGKILSDVLGLTRVAPDPNLDGLDWNVARRIGPSIAPGQLSERAVGLNKEQRLAAAEAALKGMSMTGQFARLVMLAGHGASTVNNPHATALDCGACGGHTGEANARVAAAALNDPDVRAGLVAKGINLPSDVWFIAALHDTTTDEVKLFDQDKAPPTHRDEIEKLKNWLAKAGSLARLERAKLLGVDKTIRAEPKVIARSRDWSQVRPEWGLAGNAVFIAAPRARTAGLDLGGRCFLHSYECTSDPDFKVLELIMTAPMVVASWINLQYFGSTVNNRVFGSGNKTLHNVVGQIGVLEGNGGDLKVGLPLQSVHDGKRFIHEPLRLNVFLEAPESAIESVIEKNPRVRELVDNGWVHLFALSEEGTTIHRYRALGHWQRVAGEASSSLPLQAA
jgi:uncharacterized protein YbcC (UPF0753/DUF2309 family)